MAEEKKEKKSGKKLAIIIVLLLIFVGGGTFGGVYYFMSKNAASNPVIIEEAFVSVGEEIFVNLSDENSKRYVKLNLSLSYDKANKDLAAEIEQKQVVIRDVAIFYIKSLKAKDFEPANEAKLKGDLISRINKKLTKGVLKDVYISDIIVQ